MNPSEIPYELFSAAHEAAASKTPNLFKDLEFSGRLADELMSRLTAACVESVILDAEKSRNKIMAVLQIIKEEKGVEFMMEQKSAFQIAFFHRMAARLSTSDMPRSSSRSGAFRLDLPSNLPKITPEGE